MKSLKQIRTLADLAINGAPPAFEKPLHVGRPNIGSKERFYELAEQMFERRWLTNNGPLVQELEKKVAEYHEVKHCVAMCNGTIALEIAIRALGLEGEVIVPSYTFIATVHALHWQAITPVFADIDPATHTLDPEAVKKMITPRTTGIIGVHTWGNVCDTETLQSIAGEYDLKLMYDAAHAFGCSRNGTLIGNFGECEVLSFHATKFFNTFEGGAVLTNSDELAEQMRLMRNFGFAGLDNVIYPGTNGKMSEIAAAMGLVNLDEVESIIETNRRNHDLYKNGLKDVPHLSLLSFDPAERNNFQYVVVEVEKNSLVSRDSLVDALHAENVLARKYFWPGCHVMHPYKELYPHADQHLVNTSTVADRVMVLPTGTSINEETIVTVTEVMRLLIES